MSERTQVRALDPRSPTAGLHFVVVVAGPGSGARREVASAPIVIGRDESAELRLDDASVSRRHCRLELQGDTLHVEDLGSTNGSFLDGRRLAEPSVWPPGATLQVGDVVLVHDVRGADAVARESQLEVSLQRAADYVRALLPVRLDSGPVRSCWRYTPCERLGGDALGHRVLSDGRVLCYLLDVSGHGTGAALHAVSVLNTLRQEAQPGLDPGDPAAVLGRLNEAYAMERHGGLYLTLWLGVYDPARRELVYASAGHPPALLAHGRELDALATPNPALGMVAGLRFEAASRSVPPGSRLYVYSDGAYEIRDRSGRTGRCEDLAALVATVAEPSAERTLERIEESLLQRAAGGRLEDDLSLLCLDFV